MTDTPTAAQRLEHLHEIANFDWGLIANLTRVSLHTIHRAHAGKPLPPRAAELLEALIQLVESSPATTPGARRDWLFQTIPGGQTRIQWFAALSRGNRAPLQGSGYTPAELLGATPDEDPPAVQAPGDCEASWGATRRGHGTTAVQGQALGHVPVQGGYL